MGCKNCKSFKNPCLVRGFVVNFYKFGSIRIGSAERYTVYIMLTAKFRYQYMQHWSIDKKIKKKNHHWWRFKWIRLMSLNILKMSFHFMFIYLCVGHWCQTFLIKYIECLVVYWHKLIKSTSILLSIYLCVGAAKTYLPYTFS